MKDNVQFLIGYLDNKICVQTLQSLDDKKNVIVIERMHYIHYLKTDIQIHDDIYLNISQSLHNKQSYFMTIHMKARL